MKRANLVLNLIFAAGLALIISGFLLIVPVEYRTPVAYMNLVLTVMLYAGLWLRFTLLYPKKSLFAERIPLMTVYWAVFFKFAVVEILAMVFMGIAGVSFKWQIFIHLVIFFLFSVIMGSAFWLSRTVRDSTSSDKAILAGPDALRAKANLLLADLSALGPGYAGVAAKFSAIADDIRYLSGSTLPEAAHAEETISARLDALSSMITSRAEPSTLENFLPDIARYVAARKSLPLE